MHHVATMNFHLFHTAGLDIVTFESTKEYYRNDKMKPNQQQMTRLKRLLAHMAYQSKWINRARCHMPFFL